MFRDLRGWGLGDRQGPNDYIDQGTHQVPRPLHGGGMAQSDPWTSRGWTRRSEDASLPPLPAMVLAFPLPELQGCIGGGETLPRVPAFTSGSA